MMCPRCKIEIQEPIDKKYEIRICSNCGQFMGGAV